METSAEKLTEKLLQLVDAFYGTPMLVVGDLILDHYIWGKVNRISPEAPVVVVQVAEEDKRPGGAGNVAKNLVSLGATVSVCSVVGDDPEGKELVSLLDSAGVNSEGILVDRGRPTTVKTRVIAHGQQVVRVDREVTHPLSFAFAQGIGGAVHAKLKESRGVIISDYAKGAVVPFLFEKLKSLTGKGLVGAGGVPILVDPKAPHFSFYTGVSIIKPNRAEAQEASGIQIQGRPSAIEAGTVLLGKWDCEMVLITLGEEGMVLVSRSTAGTTAIEVETESREVFDVSGAGDTVSAVFTLALAVGADPKEAAQLANLAAGVVVGEVGTVAVSADQLRNAIRSGINSGINSGGG